MDKKLFHETFSKLTASPQAKEELFRMIEKENSSGRRGARRAARMALAAAAVLCLLTVTAFAASGALRAAVTRLLFPAYGLGELTEIDEGHRTGSFDRTDVLNTFLEKFDQEGMGGGLTVRMADGFHTAVTPEDEDADEATAVVETSDPDRKLVVLMVRQDYGGTAGLWQVTGYRIVSAEAGEDFRIQPPEE